MSSRAFVIGAAALTFLVGSTAHAQERPRVRRLAYDARVDFAVTLTGLVWYVTSEVLKGQLVPKKCRWCYRRADGSDALNGVDGSVRRALVWKDPRTPHSISNALAFGILPVTSIGLLNLAAVHDGASSQAPIDALLVAEASMLALDVNQMAKYAFARERPFVHFLPRAPEEVRKLTASPSDDNLSFFSGHTTGAFAVATSAGTIASMRGYRLAPVVWGTGVANALAVGYLRIAADKHYFSDVVVAAIFGTLIGAGIPLLFHRPEGDLEASRPSSTPAGTASAPASFSFSGTW